MSWIDVAIVIPILWGLYRGIRKGFVIMAASFASLFIALYMGIKFSDAVSAYLGETFEMKSRFLPALSFSLVFILILIGVFFLSRIINNLTDAAALGWANKSAGAVFGVLQASLIMSLVLLAVDGLNEKVKLVPVKERQDSYLYTPVSRIAVYVIPAVKDSPLMEVYRTVEASVKGPGKTE